jgi:hypothetical protein
MVVSQHSGDGKANQYFLRGYNLDHGTDFSTSIDGVPVNMPTNAHGQGYPDLNFLIPELVSKIEYRKGPYTEGTAAQGWSVDGVGYASHWTSTDQVPLALIQSGQLGRYSALDPTDGGKSSRAIVSGEWHQHDATAYTNVSAFAQHSELTLWSDFTFFELRPAIGDQFKQSESRNFFGGHVVHGWEHGLFGADSVTVAGLQIRHDHFVVGDWLLGRCRHGLDACALRGQQCKRGGGQLHRQRRQSGRLAWYHVGEPRALVGGPRDPVHRQLSPVAGWQADDAQLDGFEPAGQAQPHALVRGLGRCAQPLQPDVLRHGVRAGLPGLADEPGRAQRCDRASRRTARIPCLAESQDLASRCPPAVFALCASAP